MTYSLLIATAIAEINENFPQLYGINELAESLQVNKSYLIRRFKKETGISPGRYLQTVRIGRAKKLLSGQGYPLEAIAPLCGFSGANYFCKAFKKETGETPTAFRNRTAPPVMLYVPDPETEGSETQGLETLDHETSARGAEGSGTPTPTTPARENDEIYL